MYINKNPNIERKDSSLIDNFRNLISEKYKSLHQVSDYAELLYITPGHLNDTVKKFTGKTAKQIIQEHLILEMKRSLVYENKSIKEIAYDFNFDNPAYFNSFFKKLTLETPAVFRNKILEKYN